MNGTRCRILGRVVGITLVLAAGRLAAQTPVSKDAASLVVEGLVRQVYRSDRDGGTDYLIEIEVQRSEGRRAAGPAKAEFPGPGETVYVHAYQTVDAQGRRLAQDRHVAIPEAGAKLRAYLAPREQGGWVGTYPEWFDTALQAEADSTVARRGGDPLDDHQAVDLLGMTTDPLEVQGQLTLRVTTVERGGPAQKAGFEPGDVIIGVDGKRLTSATQIEELAASGKPMDLVVLDVRTGRTAQVELTPAPLDETAGRGRQPKSDDQPKPPTRSLGISAEPVSIGQRTALKVVSVTPDGPAAKAGLEPDDVIVAANGAAITGPEQLAAAVRKSGPTLSLTVRDRRTGRNATVEVKLEGAEAPATLPDVAPPASNAKPGALGVVAELAFFDAEAAVKVTEVEPGGPADRAGLKAGVIVLEVNGEPVLHPDELTEKVRTSSGRVRLTIVDPRGGRKTSVDVDVRR